MKIAKHEIPAYRRKIARAELKQSKEFRVRQYNRPMRLHCVREIWKYTSRIEEALAMRLSAGAQKLREGRSP